MVSRKQKVVIGGPVTEQYWPRDGMAAIIGLKTKEERARYLAEKVPDNFKPWVKHLVEDHYAKKAAERRKGKK